MAINILINNFTEFFSLSLSLSYDFQPYIRGIPDYDHTYGFIRFDRSVKPISDRIEEKPEQTDTNNSDGLFKGTGFSLKKGRK